MKWYLAPWKKFAVFTGRARRSEYWTFVLINAIIGAVLNSIPPKVNGQMYSIWYPIFSLIILIPGLAVMVRRLHDTGRSGWNWLWALLPIIGWIVLLVFFVQDSKPGDNEYGPNPKVETN
ncbi:MAG: DUF805 domain-containing protein [Caldisericia bacterium]|nr:DUF805 domain-containing protein [Caldisericia bacterium]MDD4614455.1 DUF805 domain-containing protein [Caldisericia bacterium]